MSTVLNIVTIPLRSRRVPIAMFGSLSESQSVHDYVPDKLRLFQNISLQKICRLLICLTHFVSCRPSCIAAHFLSRRHCCAARKSESRSRCDCGWHSLASSPSRKRQFLFTFFILFLPVPNEISWAKIHNNVGLFCCPGVYATTPRLVSWKC